MSERFQLYQGDCLQILSTLAAGSVDAVITDPPYQMRSKGGIPIRGNGVGAVTNMSYNVGEPWGYDLTWIDYLWPLEPKHIVVFCNSYMLGSLCSKLELEMEIGAVFVWKKPNAPPSCRNTPRWDCEFIVWAKDKHATNVRAKEFQSQVLEVNFPTAGCFASERILKRNTLQAEHPTQKPLGIVNPFVERLTQKDWVILDPFAGTGTTGVSALRRNRRFVGIELDKGYFEIARKRIEDAARAADGLPKLLAGRTEDYSGLGLFALAE